MPQLLCLKEDVERKDLRDFFGRCEVMGFSDVVVKSRSKAEIAELSVSWFNDTVCNHVISPAWWSGHYNQSITRGNILTFAVHG